MFRVSIQKSKVTGYYETAKRLRCSFLAQEPKINNFTAISFSHVITHFFV